MRAGLWLALAAASWGLGTVVAKRAVGEIAPFTLLAIQLAASVAVTALAMRWRGIPLRDPATPPALIRLGLLNPGLAYGLSLIGLASISVSLSVLLWALEPLLILVLAAALLRERVGIGVLGLSAVAIGGLVLVAQPAMAATAVGVVLTVAGVVCCAFYTVGARRWIGAADSTAQVVLGQQIWALGFATVLEVVFAIAGEGPAATGPGLGDITPVGLASAVGSGVLYYAVAYWFYLSALRQVPAPLASASFYLVPVFGVAGGFLLLGETLSAGQWLGVAIAAAAVIGILGRTLPRSAPGMAASPVLATSATSGISARPYAAYDSKRG